MVLVIRHVALERYKYIRRSGNIVCVFMCKVDIDSWPSYYFNGSYYIYIIYKNEIIAIAQSENPPRSKKALEQRLIEFEGYWQAQLGTIHPKGLNIRNELKRSYYKYNTSF